MKSNKSKPFFRKLKEAEEEGRVLVILTDEYNTSQVCSVCGVKGLKKLRTNEDDLYGVLVYPNCGKVWQPDANASRNIHCISTAGVGGRDRPVAFRSPEYQRLLADMTNPTADLNTPGTSQSLRFILHIVTDYGDDNEDVTD
ncbi:hypothetical protein Unana1_03966 [Umbelopsis nana]